MIIKNRIVVLGLFCVLACSSELQNKDTGVACEGATSRCDGDSFQLCKETDTFVEQYQCGGTTFCDSVMGCIGCDPSKSQICDGDTLLQCNGGEIGQVIESCGEGGCSNGSCQGAISAGSCNQGAELVYVVDADTRLLSFDPRELMNGQDPFKLIGEINCPAGPSLEGGTATPFSMSVDRNGTAWVLYSSGELFYVSTMDASCQMSGINPGESGYSLFGMGFVSETSNSNREKLYVAGTGGQLGFISPETLQLSTIGSVPFAEQSPELTGTGDGKLYSYFPGAFTSSIKELSKDNGNELVSWELEPSGSVNAWAFAHWGGLFYMFITVDSFFTTESKVIEFNPISGQENTVLSDIPYRIVGAGVSTCAPVVIE